MDDPQEQAIAKALSKYELPNEGLEVRLLTLFYAKERDFERFYRQASKLAGDERMRKALDLFAEDEAAHQAELQEAYEEYKGCQSWPDTLEHFLENCPREGETVRAGASSDEVFDIAVDLEKDAQELYERRMSESTDPEVTEALEYLAVLEEEHYIKLKALRDELQ